MLNVYERFFFRSVDSSSEPSSSDRSSLSPLPVTTLSLDVSCWDWSECYEDEDIPPEDTPDEEVPKKVETLQK
jgi:hypothetical protein